MEKEILSMAIIKKELKKFHLQNVAMCLLFLPFYALICVMAVFLLVLFLSLFIENKLILNIISVAILTLLGALYLFVVFHSIVLTVKVLIGNFQILQDRVVDKLPKRRGRYSHRPHTLRFGKIGDYPIKDMEYKWSQLYYMSDDAVFRQTDICDEFYVIKVGKVNLLAYNKKMFELAEGITCEDKNPPVSEEP